MSLVNFHDEQGTFFYAKFHHYYYYYYYHFISYESFTHPLANGLSLESDGNSPGLFPVFWPSLTMLEFDCSYSSSDFQLIMIIIISFFLSFFQQKQYCLLFMEMISLSLSLSLSLLLLWSYDSSHFEIKSLSPHKRLSAVRLLWDWHPILHHFPCMHLILHIKPSSFLFFLSSFPSSLPLIFTSKPGYLYFYKRAFQSCYEYNNGCKKKNLNKCQN